MLLHIAEVLRPEEAAGWRAELENADWADGRITAGFQSARTKHNLQMPEDHPVAQRLSANVIAALEKNPLFMGAALPLRVFPPLFNRYDPGQSFGTHVDNAVRQVAGTPHRVRTDLSATLFLTPPEAYDGGELIVEDTYGTQSVKLPAGDMILYPSTSLHHVRSITRGSRISAFFWIQSMVRDDGRRALLFDLDTAIQRIAAEAPDHPATVQLTGVYHNLIRMWAEL